MSHLDMDKQSEFKKKEITSNETIEDTKITMGVLQDCNSFQNFIASLTKMFLWLAMINACTVIGLLRDFFCLSEHKDEPLNLDQNFEGF